MTKDDRTVGFYDDAADNYADKFATDVQGEDIAEFTRLLPVGGRVLDIGCGPGHYAALFKSAGFVVDAVDASQSMLDIAKSRYGIDGRLATFDQISDQERYDGIWCNFSLLHISRDEAPGSLSRLFLALKSNGILHLALKTGKGEKRDRLGRFYTYYEQNELFKLLTGTGFLVVGSETGKGTGMSGEEEPWIIVRAKKL